MVGLEQVKEFLKIMDAFFTRTHGPLSGKQAIMAYTGMKEVALDDAIRGGLPVFKLGNKLYSHTQAIDQWFVAKGLRQINIRREEDLKEGG